MPAATQAPPAASPPANPPAPRPGPSVAAVTMPTPPAVPAATTPEPYDLEAQLAKHARPIEDGIVHKNNTPKQPEPPKPAEAAKPEAVDEPGGEEQGKETVPVETKPGEAKPVAAPKDAKKVSWGKLLDEHKAARLKAEGEAAELRKLIKDEATAKAEFERLTKAEARAKELEDHLRFVDYQNHPEFKEKYQKPYDDSFNRLMKRLAGVGVTESDGTKRAVSVKDILELGSLPADAVIEQAEAKFGKLGGWVAERIEDLKVKSEERMEALERAKKEGSEKAQREAQEFQTRQKEMNEFLSTTWKKASEEIETHSKYGQYFKAREGDEEYNSRLQKGTELVDKALSETPTDPSLTPQQREAIVKRHAAMRQRARAFGPMQLTIERLTAERDALKAKLSQYEASEPSIQGRESGANGSTPTDNRYTLDHFEQELIKRSRPMMG